MTTAAAGPLLDHALDADSDGLILERRARRQRRLAHRDRGASLAIGGALVATALALALKVDDGAGSLWACALLVALYVLVSLVEFEIGTVVAVPTQLVL